MPPTTLPLMFVRWLWYMLAGKLDGGRRGGGEDEQVGDWNAVIWCSLCISSIVVLLEDDAIFGNVCEGDVGVCYCVYQTGCANVGLDSDTICALFRSES